MKNELAKEKGQVLKREVLTHYGNGYLACVKCQFFDIRALSIDHISGGGTRRRGGRRSSGVFYRWLKNNGYPLGYQTLCMNCQFIKRFENREDYWHTGRRREREAELRQQVLAGPAIRTSPKAFRRFINKLPCLRFNIKMLEANFDINPNSPECQRLYTFLSREVKLQKLKRIDQGVYERIVAGVNEVEFLTT